MVSSVRCDQRARQRRPARMLAALVVLLVARSAAAQALKHPDPYLDYVYPAGAQQGQTVSVEFGGLAGLLGAKEILIEGPPGISVAEVTPGTANLVKAKLVIAADAVPGKRLLRVAGGPSGLTNCRPFFVGKLPETLEVEPNNERDKPQVVSLPVVVNGRLEKTLDVDHYQFSGQAGQSLVCAISAHGMDSAVRQSYHRGFLDTSLELLDADGRTVAQAEDTLGLDPLLHLKLPADGAYVVRVRAVAYQGAVSAVYRLTLGAVPYLTSVFPPGGRRGETVEVELHGPNIAEGTRGKLVIPADEKFPLQEIGYDHPLAASQWLKFVRGDLPESVEREPNNDRATSGPLTMSSTVNARFEAAADEDWYRIVLTKGQAVTLHTLAQRHLRAPVDTVIELFDASGKKLAEDDDGRQYMGQAWHDFEAADSRLVFTPPQDGEYFVRLTNSSGIFGRASVYRLTVEPYVPDFLLFQWPDVAPVWGPGGTSAFIVQAFTWGGLESDIQVSVAGLPAGWKSSVSNVPANYAKLYANTQIGCQVLVTLTAPPDAPLGARVPFRVWGKAVHDGKEIEHEAQYLTLYGNSHNDRMFLRYSSGAQAVVASPLGCRLETSAAELTVKQGGTVEVPVKVERFADFKGDLGLGIDGSTVAAGTAWKPPTTLAAGQNEISLPLTISPEWRPGTYNIVVSRWWAADIRTGRPGPCTPAIRLHILPADGVK